MSSDSDDSLPDKRMSIPPMPTFGSEISLIHSRSTSSFGSDDAPSVPASTTRDRLAAAVIAPLNTKNKHAIPTVSDTRYYPTASSVYSRATDGPFDDDDRFASANQPRSNISGATSSVYSRATDEPSPLAQRIAADNAKNLRTSNMTGNATSVYTRSEAPRPYSQPFQYAGDLRSRPLNESDGLPTDIGDHQVGDVIGTGDVLYRVEEIRECDCAAQPCPLKHEAKLYSRSKSSKTKAKRYSPLMPLMENTTLDYDAFDSFQRAEKTGIVNAGKAKIVDSPPRKNSPNSITDLRMANHPSYAQAPGPETESVFEDPDDEYIYEDLKSLIDRFTTDNDLERADINPSMISAQTSMAALRSSVAIHVFGDEPEASEPLVQHEAYLELMEKLRNFGEINNLPETDDDVHWPASVISSNRRDTMLVV